MLKYIDSHPDEEAFKNPRIIEMVNRLRTMRQDADKNGPEGDIARQQLFNTTRGMKRDGLVVRTARATRPPRVEYALTPLGETLVGPLSGILAWAEAHFSEVDEARASFDRGFSS